MRDNVINHPTAWARTDLSPSEALRSAEQYDWESVIVAGFVVDGDALAVRSSHMTREQALWIVEHLRLHVLDRL